MQVRSSEKQIQMLKSVVQRIHTQQSESIEDDLHSDLQEVMISHNDEISKVYSEGTFARLFWDEQRKAALSKTKRWHPLMIKWCLNLKLLSSSAYHTLRTSGFIQLPSERTLRDYTHYFKSASGFYPDLNEQLKKESAIDSLPESRRYVVLIVDEMKIKEDLVYDKYAGHLIGFTSLGEVNDQLMKLEQVCASEPPPISKSILVLMVRGVFFNMAFPYAHFGTNNTSADMLFPIMWEAVCQIESIGLKVICITGDGASLNRKFFRMHRSAGSGTGIVYKTHNPYANPVENRYLYFVSDPSHLVKTIRNCWSHSSMSGTRLMTVSSYSI